VRNIEHRPVGLAESDLRILYAKINAHEVLFRVILRSLANRSSNPAKALEKLRAEAMEEGDLLTRRTGDPNPEFASQGMLETLQFIARTFSSIKDE
jgi:hypothetical protein